MYNKHGFTNIQTLIDNSVFLKMGDNKVIMYKMLNRESNINNSFPALAFVADVKEKKLRVEKTYMDYNILVGLDIIDDSCEDSSLVRMYNDFISQYAKFTLSGSINN